MTTASHAQSVRSARKAAGLCTACGKCASVKERAKCRPCLDAHVAEAKRSRGEKTWATSERLKRLREAWL